MEDSRGKLILVTGGARSGKSTFAERYAVGSDKKVIYIATAGADDEEMKRRIENHRLNRPVDFVTVEEQYYPCDVLSKQGDAGTFFLLDCLTLLLNNHLLGSGDHLEIDESKENILKRADVALEYISFLAGCMQKNSADVLVVTNEVGMGVVPEHFLGRVYRDMAGKANQLVAAQSDETWLLVCGIPTRIK